LRLTETVYGETIICATVIKFLTRSQNTLDHDSHRGHDGVLPEHVHVMRYSTDGFLWRGGISWRVTLNQRPVSYEPSTCNLEVNAWAKKEPHD